MSGMCGQQLLTYQQVRGAVWPAMLPDQRVREAVANSSVMLVSYMSGTFCPITEVVKRFHEFQLLSIPLLEKSSMDSNIRDILHNALISWSTGQKWEIPFRQLKNKVSNSHVLPVKTERLM